MNKKLIFGISILQNFISKYHSEKSLFLANWNEKQQKKQDNSSCNCYNGKSNYSCFVSVKSNPKRKFEKKKLISMNFSPSFSTKHLIFNIKTKSFKIIQNLVVTTFHATGTAQKIKFSIKDFFSKCDRIRSFLRIWSHLMKKSFMENFIFYAIQSLSVTPEKIRQTSDVFRGYRKRSVAWKRFKGSKALWRIQKSIVQV